MKELAAACCAAGMSDRGIKHYKQCMKYDPKDTVRSREGLVCALIDDGRGDEAREYIEKYEDNASAVLAYCLVILEYVSWEVLEEAGSSEEIVREAFLKAFKLNPFIAVFLARNESFIEAVEYVEEIKEPKVGSIEESFVYCSSNIGVWLDTVGATAWIDKELAELPEPEATAEHYSDEMYLGMYETANEMYKEAMAADEEQGGDDEEDDDEEDEEDDGGEIDEPWGDQ
jgi:tetratricopeptide (TPR) repeat protein